jgi:hypothetical protein
VIKDAGLRGRGLARLQAGATAITAVSGYIRVDLEDVDSTDRMN